MTFRFAYGRTLKPLISMISGFPDVSLSPQTNIIQTRRPQDTLKNPINPQNNLKTYELLYKLKMSELDISKLLEKTGAENDEDMFKKCLTNSGYGINIFQKTGNGYLVNLWNFETKKLWNQETKKLWNQEIEEPRHFETKKPRKFETEKPRNQEALRPSNQETEKPTNKKNKKP